MKRKKKDKNGHVIWEGRWRKFLAAWEEARHMIEIVPYMAGGTRGVAVGRIGTPK